MNRNESTRIAVAETSVILRSGVVAALKRSSTNSLQFVELDSPENFARQIRPYSPNMLIINPFFGGQFNISRCRTDRELGLTDTKIVALVTAVVDPAVLEQYDACISLYDDEQTLRSTLDEAMGVDENMPEDVDDVLDGDEEPLSTREKEIICEVVKGKTNKEVAHHFNLSVFTVQTHRRNIARKLRIHSSTALAIYAITNKLVSINEVKQP